MTVSKNIKNMLLSMTFSLMHRGERIWECPICRYKGPFLHVTPPTGRRQYAKCPGCKALERHRLQYLVFESLFFGLPCASMKMIHFAPEKFFMNYFRERFGSYETADLNMEDVDHKVDLTSLPFASQSVDFVLASHVLEHIHDDLKALSEISRVLKPGGIAILPVPLVSDITIEYPQPNPAEAYHVRAPGYEDYYSRYMPFFERIETYSSDEFPERFQVSIYEDRTNYPSEACPWRLPMNGECHYDIVPVCFR